MGIKVTKVRGARREEARNGTSGADPRSFGRLQADHRGARSLAERLKEEFYWTLDNSKGHRLRTYKRFAEDEIILPEGPFEGHRFRVWRQPIAGLVLDGFDLGYTKNAIIGCVQSGKTFLGLVVPVTYHLYEMKETVVLAAPTIEMCNDKYRREVLPVMERSPNLKEILPLKGRGSRGGNALSIEMNNGSVLKFMSGAGKEANMAGFTTRVVCITEVDKMDTASEISRESDPVTLIMERTLSWGEDYRVFLESTATVPEGRIWVEYEEGTGHQPFVTCIHCGAQLLPTRDMLIYPPEVKTARAAGRNAKWYCSECGEAWTNNDRREMVANAKLVPKEEEADTDCFSVRWNAFHNVMTWTTSFIASKKHSCDKAEEENTPDYIDRKKHDRQKIWAEPYEDDDWGDLQLNSKEVRKRVNTWNREVVPDDTKLLTYGIDIGKSTCWWVALACYGDWLYHIPCYGAFTVESDLEEAAEVALWNSLVTFKEEHLDQGLRMGGGTKMMDGCWIDARYMTKVVSTFVRLQGGHLPTCQYRCSYGLGSSVMERKGVSSQFRLPAAKDQLTRWIGEQWYGKRNRERRVIDCFFDADYWKLFVQRRLVTPRDRPGSLTFYKPIGHDPRSHEHAKISTHLCNEQLRTEVVEGKGPVKQWVKSGMNHWLDALTQAMACASSLGFSYTGGTSDTKAT